MIMSPTEIIAVVSSLICVYFTLKNNIWCWPFGLVGVIAYGFVFYDVKLYSDVILQCIYVVLQFVGWYAWLHGGKDKNKLPVTDLSGTAKAGWIAVALLGSAAWGHLMATNTDAAAPYPDAFIVVVSLIAQWLLCIKKVQAWIAWIVVDVVAIGVYYYKGLYLTSGLYALFFVMATMGYFEWRKLSEQTN
jgi:nicotinamide mononucleotide transporter